MENQEQQLTVTGKLKKVLDTRSGTSGQGKNWTKKEAWITTPGEYPKEFVFTCFNNVTIKILEELQAGDEVKIFINMESREYNDNFYTTITAYRIEKLNKSEKAKTEGKPAVSVDDEDSGLPF